MARHFELRWLVVVVAVFAVFAVGCGGAMPMRKESAGDPAPPTSESPVFSRQSGAGGQDAASKRADAGEEDMTLARAKVADGKDAGGRVDPVKKAAAAPVDPVAVSAAPTPPMIIYTHTLDIVVKDLDVATPEVEKLVAAHKGYVAKSEVKSDSGARRTATYTLRVPVGADRPLKDGLLALGTPERNAVETQDVGEEFVDVEKRIKNLRELEDKLNELLKDRRKEEKLEEVKGLMKEIAGVRGDIERAQGRREYLLNRTSYSTTYLTLREIKDYKPPTAATFGTRLGDTFEKSWEGLVDFGQGLVLAAVALAPWAPIWLPAVVALVWAGRRLRRLSRESAEATEGERPRLAAEEAVAGAEATERVDLRKPPPA